MSMSARVHVPQFIHSSVNGHLCCLCVLAIVNDAAVSMGYVYLLSWCFVFGWIPRSGFAWSHDSSIFNSLRNFPTVFYNGCTNLHSHQHSQSFPFLHVLNSICFVIFLIIAFPIDVRYYLTVFDLPFLFNDTGHHIGHQYVCSYALPIFQLDCLFFFYWVVWVL